jgi:hypothetical protein
VTAALVDLCHGYVASRGRRVPVDVGERHEGVATPAWMLAVAVVRPGSRDIVSDTLELALSARVPRGALGDCVAYVELAAALFAGRPVAEAVGALGGGRGRRGDPAEVASGPLAGRPALARAVAVATGDAPRLTGEGPADALSAGLWALHQPVGLAEVMPVLARVATPGVAAAVGGLLGLRDGCAGMPAHWQCRVRGAAACLALAPGLVRARCRDHVARPADVPDPVVERPPDEPEPGSRPGVGLGVERCCPVPPAETAASTGVTVCRPSGRAFRGNLGRKPVAELVGAR